MAMDRITLSAFADELKKIAESPAIEANNFFGLPVPPNRKRVRNNDQGSTAASGYRENANMAGDPAPSIDFADRVNNPTQGPGGV